MEREGQYWYVQFKKGTNWSTYKVWAATMPQAIVRGSEEHAKANGISRATSDAEMQKAGVWGAD